MIHFSLDRIQTVLLGHQRHSQIDGGPFGLFRIPAVPEELGR